MTSAGRILIMPKGNYDPSVTYEMLDLVFYNGGSWLAKETAVGIEPSETNSKYWHNMLDFDPGSADISHIGDGSVKGAIANLESRKANGTSIWLTHNPNGTDYIDYRFDIASNNTTLTVNANVVSSVDVYVVGVNVIDITPTTVRVVIKLNKTCNEDLTISVGFFN